MTQPQPVVPDDDAAHSAVPSNVSRSVNGDAAASASVRSNAKVPPTVCGWDLGAAQAAHDHVLDCVCHRIDCGFVARSCLWHWHRWIVRFVCFFFF
jgi:hypothetical protein